MTKAAAAKFCLIVLLAGCSAQGKLEQRTRDYFQIPSSQQVSAATIRSAALSGVPLGSSTKQVYAYLERRGIGKDGLSSYYPVDEKGEIVCRVEYDPKSLDVVKKSFGIIFVVDTEGKLRDILVKEWLTGL